MPVRKISAKKCFRCFPITEFFSGAAPRRRRARARALVKNARKQISKLNINVA
jgi:hypothetical protein